MAKEKSTHSKEDINAKFIELFWKARREHRKFRTKATADKPEHKKAMAYAEANNIGWGKLLLKTSLKSWQGKNQEALEELEAQWNDIPTKYTSYALSVKGLVLCNLQEYDKAISVYQEILKDSNFDKPGSVWFSIGYAYGNKGDYDKAIECCEKALGCNNYDKPGDAWNNMGNAYSEKGAYDKAIECYKEALECDSYENPGDAWNNMGNAYSRKGDYDKAIECYEKALGCDSYDKPEKAWNNMGIVYGEKGDYDKAIESYKKALGYDNYDTPGDAWNNMGIAYGEKGDYDKAIECCEKALGYDSYDTPGGAWNNMGIAYGGKGDYDKTIECCEKALGCNNYNKPEKAWNNMGNAYYEKGDYDKAIECYKEALGCDNYDKPGATWYNMANAYYNKEDYKEAIKAYGKAIERSPEDSWIKFSAKRQVSLLKTNIKPEAMSEDDRASFDLLAKDIKYDSEERLRTKIWGKRETKYDEYLKKENSGRDDVFSILRGWSSAVTLLDGSEMEYRGGGYFIKWKDKGIVIDPGMDFLRNFHDEGYHGREIDAVLVSHNHPDHNFDLRAIDDLKYELYKRRNEKEDGKIRPYMLMWDRDSCSKINFQPKKNEHRYEDHAWNRTQHDRIKKQHDIPFEVECFRAYHDEDNLRYPVGFKVHLLSGEETEITIGYTGDTAYRDEIGENLKECDILLAHISQPDKKEFVDPEHLKKNHLGYNGLIKLIKAAEPKLTLVGEFWAGIEDFRIDIVKCLRERTGCSTILPAGLGMDIKLPGMEIECSGCGKDVPLDEVRVGPAGEDFGKLSYLCKDCCLF